MWMDYRACRWPPGMDEKHVSSLLAAENDTAADGHASTVITYSHFVPRVDVLPTFIPVAYRFLDPILGTTRLEHQLRELTPKIHVYGHSHFNRRVQIDGAGSIRSHRNPGGPTIWPCCRRINGNAMAQACATRLRRCACSRCGASVSVDWPRPQATRRCCAGLPTPDIRMVVRRRAPLL